MNGWGEQTRIGVARIEEDRDADLGGKDFFIHQDDPRSLNPRLYPLTAPSPSIPPES